MGFLSLSQQEELNKEARIIKMRYKSQCVQFISNPEVKTNVLYGPAFFLLEGPIDFKQAGSFFFSMGTNLILRKIFHLPLKRSINPLKIQQAVGVGLARFLLELIVHSAFNKLPLADTLTTGIIKGVYCGLSSFFCGERSLVRAIPHSYLESYLARLQLYCYRLSIPVHSRIWWSLVYCFLPNWHSNRPEIPKSSEIPEELECEICFDLFHNPTVLYGKFYCRSCIEHQIKEKGVDPYRRFCTFQEILAATELDALVSKVLLEIQS